MTITSPDTDDWKAFYDWATVENWRVSFHEKHLFLNQWRPYFYVLWEDGRRCAFVSAVLYKTSGWIGNLLVDPQQRHQGHGRALFEFALQKLRDQPNVSRTWLTASAQGAPLYRKYGFTHVDTIQRWSGCGRGDIQPIKQSNLESLIDIDSRCWGESRASLLHQLANDSYPLYATDTAALLQAGIDFWQLGPWSTTNASAQACQSVLRQCLSIAPKAKPVITDILASSRLSLTLQHSGFKCHGTNELMCLSRTLPAIEGVIALASLGSIG